MIQVLLITPEKDRFLDLSATLKQNGATISWASSGSAALDALGKAPVDLVVADEKVDDMTGLEFADRLVALNPMINCALVSGLDKKEFHEVSEGLGILMQLPAKPDPTDAERLANHLKQILGFTSNP